MPYPMKKQLCALAALCGLCSLNSRALADSHVVAGADANGQLTFISGGLSSTLYRMLPEPVGRRYAGYIALDEQVRAQFPNDYFSFTAASDGQTEVAQPGHAKTGADIWVEITSVSGPTGATFGFWEAMWSYSHTTPTKTFLTNTATGGYRFEISEPLSFLEDEEQDPYGHIHDRGWTVDQFGDYYIGFTLYDLSHVGPGGGPLHTPSQTYTFHFVAVPEPGTFGLLSVGFLLAGAARFRLVASRSSHTSQRTL